MHILKFDILKQKSLTLLLLYNITQPQKDLIVNELKDVFFSLKLNKSPGYDEVSFNVIKKCFGNLHKPLRNASLQNGDFPDE